MPLAHQTRLPSQRLTRSRPGTAILVAALFAAAVPMTVAATGLVTAKPAERVLTLTGFTRPRAEFPLVAETTGRIDEVRYDLGDTVGEDGLFAIVDDTFIRLDIDENRIQQDRLRAQIDYDEREAARYRELARQQNVAASQAEALEQALRNNRHELLALETRQRGLEERLARTRIRAPIGWRVTERAVEPGQWVREGEPIGAVGDFTTLLVPFALTPEQYRLLQGDATDLSLELPDLGHRVPARLFRAHPGFDPGTRKIPVDLEVGGQLEPRRGGLRARLTLSLPTPSAAVLLPGAAVEQSYEEHWVTRADGERIQVIVLGRLNGPDGDMVRVSAAALRPGDRVRVASD
ncbi:efflux RND transporter periplasmic adaptor subunit [Thioalkalicoccus limnaeus]|uniref:Efflux RND transporter periplasmic adaptor subunit n=1 Tax=Thioalkalicoccus limnaeus TaxID=120681 RepID=A0ABV4BF14_9GAMM